MSRPALALILAALPLACLAGGPPEASPSARVSRVVDGDTVVLALDGREVKARIVGIDAPESVDPRKPVERFGKEASAHLRELAGGKAVRVERDASGQARDRYGRELVYLRLADGRDVGREMIRDGFAHAYVKYPFGRADDYRASEREAREAGRGLWGPGGEPPAPRARAAPKAPAVEFGAPTKAGTPCKRKVAGGGRCYQHR